MTNPFLYLFLLCFSFSYRFTGILYISDTKFLLVLGVTSIFLNLMGVKNCKGSEIVPYLQACHSIMSAEEDKTLRNKRRD